MTIATQFHETVGSIVAGHPHTARIFESLGIDYCCGGHRLLDDVCREKGLDVAEVRDRLAEPPREVDTTPDWNRASLTSLVQHILDVHHVYTRDATERLRPLMDKVHDVHGSTHPELSELRQLLGALAQDLEGHLMKEEHILFPFILALEAGESPQACFATVAGPIRVMLMEHDGAGDVLREMRRVTGDYEVPEGACGSYRALYQGLEELERDLHRHIHLENNILFPRTLALEAAG